MKTRILLGTLLTLSLAACEELSVSVKIEALHPFDLKTESNRRLSFAPGIETAGTASYESVRSRLTLLVNSEKVVFRNAKADEKTGRISIAAKDSKQTTSDGERVGLEVVRRLVCNPNCERRSVTIETHSCTYYEQRPVTRCYTDQYGRTNCYTNWESYPVYGNQQVEVTRVQRDYLLDAQILGETQGLLGNAQGPFTESEASERALTSCM